MAVMGAVGVHEQLGNHIYGCGAKQASGFCAASITMQFGILLHRQLSFILEECRGPVRKPTGSLLRFMRCVVCVLR